ncbi:receptor-type tyrosine-protein phosphatase C-like isoform X2 [Simochromis diagramma]|uniref:receptor-type tyrosine-protein phosphatase C-like isoform X2 n=1 Tax=Simochromis diagramma TaxID=43689 RepID=UPI001A7E7020|nr:receptor-type tyrosine-protein phosphatase C-like isoform X2 [Simochromis diagramma]
MAELCSLSTLLFWAGIIASASCGPTTIHSYAVLASSPPRMATNATVTNSTASSSPPRISTSPTAATSSEVSPPRMTTYPIVATSTASLPRTTTNATVATLSDSSPSSMAPNATVVSPSVNSTATFATRAPPASTSNETSLTPTPPSNSSDSQASPTGTTVTATTEATETTPEPPKCSYTVTPIEFGLQINVMNSPPGDYNISIIEGGRRVIEERVNFTHSTQDNIQRLKPCTEYEHEVLFIHSDGNKIIKCTSTGNKTKTKEMSKTDITGQSSINGCVCYQSNWDISSSISAPNVTSADQCSSGSKSFCVKHRDICSDFETTFTSGNCSSFSITTNIIVDLYNSSEIELSGSTGLPAVIQPTLPKIKECKHITVNYTCSEKDKPGRVNKPLSELEPFTKYSCTGLISKNNISTDKTTPPVHLNTDCDLKFNIKNKTATKSIELSWKTTSDNCTDVLHTLHNLSHDCSCSSNEKTGITGIPKLQSDGGTCEITGLEAFTQYTCGVQPKYNGKTVSNKRNVTLKTAPGEPDEPSKVTVTVPENNVIKVECHHGDNIRGPTEKIRFIARLHPGGENKPQNETDCKFEFKDLSYSTAYTVEVTVFNGYFESQPGSGTADTRYNDKAVIGFLIFLISAALLLAACVCYRKLRKRRSDVDENVASEAIYMNTRPPGWRQKEAQ